MDNELTIAEANLINCIATKLMNVDNDVSRLENLLQRMGISKYLKKLIAYETIFIEEYGVNEDVLNNFTIVNGIFKYSKEEGVFDNALKVLFGEFDIDLLFEYPEIENSLNIMGYEMNVTGAYHSRTLEILPFKGKCLSETNDLTFLEKELSECGYLKTYKEIESSFMASNYRGSLASARAILEAVFGKEQMVNNLVNITGESFPNPDNAPRVSKTSIFRHWFDTKSGFNITRCVLTLFSALSGLGAHLEENSEPTREDALMLIRMTEDVLIWYFEKK